jgi:ribose 5-phosphate isomerase B
MMKDRKIIFASDYRGIALRESLVNHAESLGLNVKDIGIQKGSLLDYVDITKLLVDELHHDPDAVGVIVCGSGQGVSISANRSTHIRAAMCRSPEDAESVRSKLNANVLCLGSKYNTFEEAVQCLSTFINTPFDAEKHGRCASKLNVSATEHTYAGVNLIVRGIVTHKNHILFTTTTRGNTEFSSDLYFLPGGHVDYRESALDALKRELKEEMNVEILESEFVGALECSWDRKGRIYHELNLVYKIDIPNLSLENPPKAVDPFHQFVWRPLSEITQYKILPEQLVPLIQEVVTPQGAKSLFLSQMMDKKIA